MTVVEQIRLLIGDTAVLYHYTDTEIGEFYILAGSVFGAAALALEAWAATLSEDAESEKIGDYSYAKKAAENKLKLAERYRTVEAETPAMTWAEMNLTRETESDVV